MNGIRLGPRLLRRALLVTALLVGLAGPLTGSASATIAMTFPRPVSYVDTVPVGWTVSEAIRPGTLTMTWTYVSGPYAGTAPVTLTLASSATSGSFTFNPSTVASSPNLSAVSGPLPDGIWSVAMQYVRASDGSRFSSSSVNVATDTATTPPLLTTPAAGGTGGGGAVPIAFTLPDVPSFSGTAPVLLTFTSRSTLAVSQLRLSTARVQSFSLDPSNLAASSSVLATTGPTALVDGSYDVALTYSDSSGHPAATTTNADWTLDRVTRPPTLLAPLAGASPWPLELRYTLPEAALSGSVRVTFTGRQTVSATLADATAGTHDVVLDPRTLATSPAVASVSPSGAAVPDGTYDVAVSYQDAFGNPAAVDQVAGVVIDTTTAAPSLTPPSAASPLTGGAIPIELTLPEAPSPTCRSCSRSRTARPGRDRA